MTPSRLRFVVGEAIRRHALWPPGARVVVAVSGGLDSVCLLDLLLVTAGWHGGALEVATCDHGTRAGQADEADFVCAEAARHGLRAHRFALALGAGASEATCRDARYAALRSVGADRIAVAHHRGDLAETVLINLMRGTGPRGVGGMVWRSSDVVRPLLGVDRAQLEAWARHRGLEWREDPTNRDPAHLRNRVRHEVLPLLEAIRPGATRAIGRSAARLAAEQAPKRAIEPDSDAS